MRYSALTAVVRVARKNAGLNLDDRIGVQLVCDAELRGAIEAHAPGIREATLAGTLASIEAPVCTLVEDADINGRSLTLGLRVRASRHTTHGTHCDAMSRR